MNTRMSWKLLPFVALVALAAFVLVPGGTLSPQSARADVDGVDGPDEVEPGDTITITVDSEDDVGDLVITVTGGDNPELDNVECSGPGTCGGSDIDGDGSDEVTIDTDDLDGDNTDDSLTVTLELLADCEDGDTLTIRAEDDEGFDEIDIDCGEAATGNITIRKDAEGGDNSDDFDFEVTSDDNSCDGDEFTLNDGDVESFDCDDSNTEFTITETNIPSGWTLEAIDCSDEGIPTSDVEIDVDDASVTFTLGSGDSIDCTFTNESGPSATSTPTSVTPETVTLSAGPNSVGCSGASFITIVVKGAGGANVSDGTTVNVTASIGTVNPSSQTTQGGGVLVLYTAPASQSGTATITATSGGRSGSTTVQVNCSPAQPTAVPQQPTPVPTQTGGGIRPPSTGDAGLADESGTSAYAGIAAVIAISSLLGVLVASRLRA